MDSLPRPSVPANALGAPHRSGYQEHKTNGPIELKYDPRTGQLLVRQRNWRRGLKQLSIIGLLIVLGGYSAYSFFFGTSGAHPVQQPDAASKPQATLPPEELKLQEEAALAREPVKKLLDQGQAIRDQCNVLDEELKRWESEIQPLWSDDTGRLIASDIGGALAFEAQTKEPRPTKTEADALRTRLGDLLTPVQNAWDAQQWSYRPATELATLIQNLQSDVAKKLDQARQPRVKIEMLIANGKSRGKPADLSLQATLDDYHTKQAAQWAQSESEARVKIEAEYATKRQQQAEQAETDKQQQQLKLEHAKQELEEQKLATATASAKNAADHEELVRRAKSSDTRQLLSFFFTPGYLQPTGKMTTEKRPFSLSLLQAARCLEPTLDGETELFGQMTNWRDHDRPLYQNKNMALPNQPDSVRVKVGQIQKALIELGPTLVELQMLDP